MLILFDNYYIYFNKELHKLDNVEEFEMSKKLPLEHSQFLSIDS